MIHFVSDQRLGYQGNSNELLVEASQIGLRPGEWPEFIAVTDENGCGFMFSHPTLEPGDARAYSTSQGRRRLIVLNT